MITDYEYGTDLVLEEHTWDASDNITLPPILSEKDSLIEGSSISDVSSSEQQENHELFKTQPVIVRWKKTELLSAQLLQINKKTGIISCECILDKEEQITQIRHFPKMLFEHLEPLKKGIYLKIKISQKPGVFRVDIINGKGMNIEQDFVRLRVFDDLEEVKIEQF